MKFLRLLLQILLPFVVIAGGAYLVYRIIKSKPQPIVQAVVNAGPLVRVQTAVLSNEALDVTARG